MFTKDQILAFLDAIDMVTLEDCIELGGKIIKAHPGTRPSQHDIDQAGLSLFTLMIFFGGQDDQEEAVKASILADWLNDVAARKEGSE